MNRKVGLHFSHRKEYVSGVLKEKNEEISQIVNKIEYYQLITRGKGAEKDRFAVCLVDLMVVVVQHY